MQNKFPLFSAIFICLVWLFLFISQPEYSYAEQQIISEYKPHQSNTAYLRSRVNQRKTYNTKASDLYKKRLNRRTTALSAYQTTTTQSPSQSNGNAIVPSATFNKYHKKTQQKIHKEILDESRFFNIQQEQYLRQGAQSLKRIAKASLQNNGVVHVTDSSFLPYLGNEIRPFITLVMITAEKQYNKNCQPCFKFHQHMKTLSENIFQNQLKFFNTTANANIGQMSYNELTEYLTYPSNVNEMLFPLKASNKPYPIIIVQLDRELAPQTLLATQIRSAPQLFILPPQFTPKQKPTREMLSELPSQLRWSPVVANLNLDAIRSVLQDHFSETQMINAKINDNSLSLLLTQIPSTTIFITTWLITILVMLYIRYQQKTVAFFGRFAKGFIILLTILIVIICLSGPSVHKGRRNMGPANYHDNILQIIQKLLPLNLFNVKKWGADGRNAFIPETVAVVIIHILFTTFTVVALETAFTIKNGDNFFSKLFSFWQSNFFERGTRHIVTRDTEERVYITRNSYLLQQYLAYKEKLVINSSLQKPDDADKDLSSEQSVSSATTTVKTIINTDKKPLKVTVTQFASSQTWSQFFGSFITSLIVTVISLFALVVCIAGYFALVGLYQRKFGNRTSVGDVRFIYNFILKGANALGLRPLLDGFFAMFEKKWTN